MKLKPATIIAICGVAIYLVLQTILKLSPKLILSTMSFGMFNKYELVSIAIVSLSLLNFFVSFLLAQRKRG
ncbi:hypothetical protein ACFSTH_04770 [Paenibacillus yanchengensis]|uniref:Uncharacterized protein n=1 Tax=Paenibacillus yanchengensis TaxID=2035833 RepID=A0ABW4YK37_9BACL